MANNQGENCRAYFLFHEVGETKWRQYWLLIRQDRDEQSGPMRQEKPLKGPHRSLCSQVCAANSWWILKQRLVPHCDLSRCLMTRFPANPVAASPGVRRKPDRQIAVGVRGSWLMPYGRKPLFPLEPRAGITARQYRLPRPRTCRSNTDLPDASLSGWPATCAPSQP